MRTPDARPVFVGGTGRSGTTVLATTIGHSGVYATIPFEIKLHTDPGGFPTLFAALDDPTALKEALDDFRDRMLGRWFDRPTAHGPVGLMGLVSQDRLVDLLTGFVEGFPDDPDGQCRALLHALLDSVAQQEHKPQWLEMTPATIYHAPLLGSIYPHARFLHIFRDGRDVASSVARRRWGPSTPIEGLTYWADCLRRAHAATDGLPADTLMDVDFGRLVLTRRRQTFAQVCDFLELPQQGPHRDYFDSQFKPRHAHLGRWTNQVPVEEQHAFNLRYTELLTELRKEGVTCVPD